MNPASSVPRRAAGRGASSSRGKRRPPGTAETQRRRQFGAEWGSFMSRTAQHLREESVK